MLTGEVARGQHGGQDGALQLSACIEFLKAVHSLLSVQCGRNTLALANPWVLQCLGRRDSFGRIDRQHGVDQVLRFRCDCVPLG